MPYSRVQRTGPEKLTFQDVTHPDDLEADLEYVGQVLLANPSYPDETLFP